MANVQLAQGDILYRAVLNVTAAQLKTLHATPVALLTPDLIVTGVTQNVVNVPISVSLHYFFKTAAFTLSTGTLKVFYGPVANGNAITADQSAILGNTANEVDPNVAVVNLGVLTEATGLNMGFYLGNDNAAEFTVGAGSLTVAVTYAPLVI